MQHLINFSSRISMRVLPQKLYYLLAISMQMCFFSCSIKNISHSTVVAVYSAKLYDSTIKKWIVLEGNPDVKIWYFDSLIIQKASIHHFTTINGKTISSYSTYYYIYFDMRNRMARNYLNFSDTALPVKKYQVSDTSYLDGGWSFYVKRRSLFDSALTSLPDTIIDGNNYKRVMSVKKLSSPTSYHPIARIIGYMRCDKKGLLFPVDSYTYLDCPMVRYDIFDPKFVPFTVELKFIANKLTEEEKMIFDTWKENAMKDL